MGEGGPEALSITEQDEQVDILGTPADNGNEQSQRRSISCNTRVSNPTSKLRGPGDLSSNPDNAPSPVLALKNLSTFRKQMDENLYQSGIRFIPG